MAQDIYWTEYGGTSGTAVIKGADIDGQNVVDVFVGTDMASFIVDLEVTDTHLYWSGHSGGDVWRSNLDGSDAQRIVDESAGLTSPHGIAVDETAGKIYIADHGSDLLTDPGGIYSSNLDGTGGVQGLWTIGSPWYYSGISRKGANELLWFSRSSEYLYIQPAGGGQPSAVELAHRGEMYGLAYDSATDTAYYTHISGMLNWVNLTTQEQGTPLTPDMTSPLGLKLSPSGTHLLIAERGRGISAYELSTGGYELLIDAPNAHFGVAATVDPGTLEVPEPPPPLEPGTVLFYADFEGDALEGPPAEGWTSVSTPAEGTILVLADAENDFGAGEENQFFRAESARDYNVTAHYDPTDVATLSFDYIGRINPDDGNRAINLNMRTGDSNNDRVHVIQINSWTNVVDTVSFGENDILYRFDLVVNNSVDPVVYDRPDGSGTATLDPGLVVLWRYEYRMQRWTLLRDSYANVRHASVNLGDRMVNFLIQVDSDAQNSSRRRSSDMDNIAIYAGAVPGLDLREADVSPPPPIPYPEVPVLVVHEDFEQYDGPRDITVLEDYFGSFETGQLDMTRMPTQGSVHIVEDTENRFGRGPDNLVMYWDKAISVAFDIPVGGIETGVATVAFDMYHEGEFDSLSSSANTNRLGARFHADSHGNPNIVNNFGFEGSRDGGVHTGTYVVRGISKQIDPNYVQRWVVVRNNTRDSITYDSPLGEIELSATNSHVWLNGFLFAEEYGYGSSQPERLINAFRFDAFNSWTAYIDDIRVWEGAIVPSPDIQRDTEPAERELLVYDGFDYSAGSVDGQNGGIGWAEGYTTMDDFGSAEVVAPGLEWPGLEVNGNSLSAAGPTPESDNTMGTRNFRTIDIDGIHSSMLNELSGYAHLGPQGGSIWLSVVGQGNPNQSGGFWGFSLYRNTSEQSGEVLFLGKGSTDTEEDGWRFAGGGGSTTGGSMRTGHPLSDKHFWVIRIDYHDDGNQEAHLFHNPDPFGAAPAEPTISRETRVGSFGFDRIRIAGNGAGFRIDEIRIGTSWEAVAPLGEAPPLPEGYGAWAAQYFPGVTHPSIIGPEADPDGDGVSNLIEYAFGMDPTEASREGLPVLGETEIDGLDYLTLTGTLPDGTNLDLAVEATSELGDWSDPDLAVPMGATSNGDGTTTYTFRDVEPIDSNGRRFMRVSVGLRDD